MGFNGCIKTIDGCRQEAYQVFAGGGSGKTETLAQLKQTLSVEQILQNIEIE